MRWQCTLLQRWLPEYPDGDLPAFWRGRLQVHLERCPTCREELVALKEVEATLQEASAADPGPEFWTEFSRQMHLKLVQADQAGQMAPTPTSSWWGRLPYLVGAPALAGLLLWLAVSYLTHERPGTAPTGELATTAQPAAKAPVPVAEIVKEKSAVPAEKMAAVPQALPPSDETKNFIYTSQRNGNAGEEMAPDDDDLEATLAGMTPQERDAFLKKLCQHEKDGSCLRKFSAIAFA